MRGLFGELAKGQQHAMRLLGDRRNHPEIGLQNHDNDSDTVSGLQRPEFGQGQIPTTIPTKCRDWYLFDWYSKNSGDSCA